MAISIQFNANDINKINPQNNILLVLKDTYLYENASLKSKKIKKIKKDDIFNLTQAKNLKNYSYTWYKTSKGWIYSEYVNIISKNQYKIIDENDEKFTIHIAYVFKNNLENFLNKYIKNNNYIIIETTYFYRILYGIYNTEELAKKGLSNISENRINEAKIIKVSNLSKEQNKIFKKEIKNNKLSLFYYLK